jgi:hypothetical protein
VARFLRISGSSERLISIVKAFLAIGYGRLERKQFGYISLTYTIVLHQKLEVFDRRQLATLEQ